MKYGDQRGMSLVQVMMSAGVIGGLALVATQFTSNMNKGLKNAESNSDVMTVVQAITRSLAVPENCTQTFQGKNPVNSPNVVTSIADKSSGSFVPNFKTLGVDPNLRYGQGQLRIKNYSLTDASDTVDVATLRTTELVVNFDKGKNGFTQDSTKKIVLKVEIDGSGNITSCVAASNANDGIWKYAANNIDIFYNSGFAGIGTITPTAPLEVVGDIRQIVSAGGGFNLVATAALPTDPGDLIFRNGDNSVRAVIQSGNGASGELHFDITGTPGDAMLIDGSGTTVNSNLVVNGTITPTNTVSVGGSCSPAGASAFAPAANSPVFCNTSGVWATMGGGTLSIDIYQCPSGMGCEDGQIVTGSWASYGCQGQISSQTTCQNAWFNGGLRTCNNTCNALGKVRVN